MLPVSPGKPGGPTGPLSPFVPLHPGMPGGPGGPSCPGMPGRPGFPGNPDGPGGPLVPFVPGSPGSPVSPLSPGGPGGPSGPCIPGNPITPCSPGRPLSPFCPFTPLQSHFPQPEQPAADTALSSALSSSPKPSQRHMLPRTALLRRSLGGGAPAAQRGVGAPRGRSHMHASPLRAGRGACNASGPCDWPRRNRWAAAAPSSPRAGGRGPWESATARSLYAGRDSYSSSSRRGWVRGGGGGAGGGAALPRPAPLRPPGRARSAAGCGAERVRRGRGRGLRRPVTAEGPLPAPGATRGLCSALLRRGGRAEPESPEPSPPAGKEPTWTFHRFPARVFLFVRTWGFCWCCWRSCCRPAESMPVERVTQDHVEEETAVEDANVSLKKEPVASQESLDRRGSLDHQD